MDAKNQPCLTTMARLHVPLCPTVTVQAGPSPARWREAQATSLLWTATLRQEPSRCATMQAHCTQGGCEPIYIRAFRLNPAGTVCAPGARRAIGGDEGQSDGHAGEPWRLDLRAPYHGVTTTTATQATDSRESQMCVALHEPCTRYIEVIEFDSLA